MDKNEIYPKRYVQSFTVGNGSRNRDAIERACQLRKEELQEKATKEQQDCFFTFEVIEGMDNAPADCRSLALEVEMFKPKIQ